MVQQSLTKEKEFITHINIENHEYKPEKMEKELCPMCQSVLIKNKAVSSVAITIAIMRSVQSNKYNSLQRKQRGFNLSVLI